MKRLLVSVCMLITMAAIESHAAAIRDRTDHPLISAYEGSQMTRKHVAEFDEYQAFTGMDETGKEPTSISLEGKITKMIYRTPKERSVLEMFRNYEIALAQAGVEVLYTCDQKKRECVERYAGPTFQKVSDIHSMQNLSGRYLLGQVQQEEHTAYVAVAVGQASTTIHVIEVKDLQTGLVSLNAEALGKGLDARGYVIVEGIYFDTDKATLQPRSDKAIGEMANLLNSRSDLAVFIVGHTDTQGALDYNRALSERRADAVVKQLNEAHGIAMSRMSGHGVGPLAPKASNSTESGRAQNRRVVMVAQ